MQTNPKLRYVEDTYKAYGNNGNCYNESINDTDCSGEYSTEIREYLYNMSDHLPVVMELETNKEFIILNTDEVSLNEQLLQIEHTLVSDYLTLKVHPSVQEFFTLEIYNTLGQKLIKNIETNSEIIQIDVSQLSQGMYFIKSSLNTNNLIKFIKTS